DRHPSLRKTFSAEHGKPLQIIHDTKEVFFLQEDASHLSEVDLKQRLSEAAWKPFDLESGPLFKIHLWTVSPEEHVLLLVIHHIISDFWSLDIMIHELGILYPALKEGSEIHLPPPPALQYLDYVRWQEEILAGPEGEKLWEYWKEKLSGELPALNLPTDRPRPPLQTYRGASETFHLNPELTEKLKALAQANGVTLYIVLLAAFQTLLHRYSAQEDILIGSPSSGRSRRDLSNLVGYLVNPVVLRGDLSGNPSVQALLQRTRDTVLEAFEHLDYPFSLLVEKLQPERDPSRSPIYQVMFVHQKAQRLGEEGLTPFALGEAGAKMQLGGMHLESMHLKQSVAQMDLTLTTAEAHGSLLASFDYNTDLFDQATIERMIGHFQVLLKGIIQHPEEKISSLPILTEREKHQLLIEWNDTKKDFPQ
ncbi:MAG TPA: non-ribosomal peptide synthetase, partial [Deltaproteobacteria bacterium]|nr:non-ribosomal peptide synthetase [Deltaproteobacteria bacterium]